MSRRLASSLTLGLATEGGIDVARFFINSVLQATALETQHSGAVTMHIPSAVYSLDRRDFVKVTAVLGASLSAQAAMAAAPNPLKIATFRADVTPPEGHPLCGGWITPVKSVADSLEAIGLVVLGAGAPIVLCAVDWTGILNRAHLEWRTALATAAGTTAERVAVQCVHQHDAPFVCLDSELLLRNQQADLTCVDVDFFHSCLDRLSQAIRQAIGSAQPLTHIATGQAKVDRIASDRRIAIGPDGRLRGSRGSSCRDPELIALPEGLIDPMLKTVTFYNGTQRVAACHYYATHPMSYYGQGEVSSDFPGLARKKLQQDDPHCTHIYFTGASGNITAGKYNIGSPESRIALTERMLTAMIASEKDLVPQAIESCEWVTQDLIPPVNPVFTQENQLAMVGDAASQPIVLSALHINSATLLHLPAESFVEYQLRAQSLAPDRFVATAAYGDGGPWYIPTRQAFPQGGYEVSVANCDVSMDDLLSQGMQGLLSKA